MHERLNDLELRTQIAERQASLALDALQVVHAKLGALEAVAVELARRADLGADDADRLLAGMGESVSPAPARNLRRELLRLLFRKR